MNKGPLGWSLCGAVLLVGVVTAVSSSSNRARGDELDRLQRWCEAQSRRNELLRLDNQRREWKLLGDRATGPAAKAASSPGEATP